MQRKLFQSNPKIKIKKRNHRDVIRYDIKTKTHAQLKNENKGPVQNRNGLIVSIEEQ